MGNSADRIRQAAQAPKKLWRYFVIEFGNDDPNLDLLEAALTVAPVSFEIGFAKIRVEIRASSGPPALPCSESLSIALRLGSGRRGSRRANAIARESGRHQIRDIFQRWLTHHKLGPQQGLELLLELKDLPRFSPLQILGYFAILESVLTHQPNPDDRYESITRQITQKLALLNRRWHPALDYSPLWE